MPYKDKKKQKEVQHAWYKTVVKERRRLWLAENGPCRRCGSEDNLEVDHINPMDKVCHNVWSWADDRRKLELSKCQVLCRRCHQEKTASDYGYYKHGLSGYRRGCRCEACTSAKVESRKQERLKLSHLKKAA